MATRSKVAGPPEPGYFTDGRRLVEFLGMDGKGLYVVEDVVTEEAIKFAPVEWDGAWRRVEASDGA